MSVVKPNNLIKQITTGTKHKKTTSKKSKQVQVTAQFRRHTSHLPYQIHFRSEVVLSSKLCRTLRFWLAQMKSVEKKLIWTPYHCQITTYYLVRHMRGTASELGLKQLFRLLSNTFGMQNKIPLKTQLD